MLCCQQAEAKSDLDCKQHSGFCFYVLYSSSGTRLARETVVRSIVNTFPEEVEETLDETPGAHVPVYKKCDQNIISFCFQVLSVCHHF